LSDSFQTPREFQPVETVEEGLKLLKEGVKTLSSAMIWTKDQGEVISSHLSVFSDSTNSFYCWIPKSLDAKKFVDEVATLPTKDCFFSVSLLKANIFFRAELMGFDSAGLHFKFPFKIFKVQRRGDVRLPIPAHMTMKVEFKDPLFPEKTTVKKVIDLSATGMAFIVLDEDAVLFPKGRTLNDFSFSVRNKKFTIRAEISNVRKLRSPTGEMTAAGYAVGVKFLELRPGEHQHIAGYVFEESRKYFSKFL
jgi:hypothetical protein